MKKSEGLNQNSMNFNDLIDYIIDAHEGGLVDHKDDPGGLTKYGISQRAFPELDIRGLTKEQAKEIYRLHYWQKIRGEELPGQLKLITLDAAINQGVDRAAKLLQKACGVKVDGIIGPKTLEALKTTQSMFVLSKYAELRLLHYQGLPTWGVFGKGWSRRLLDVAVLSAFVNENRGETLP
jgi:lysozyme family protein